MSKAIYAILDGISGCGHDTQTDLLSNWLLQKGYTVQVVTEPSDPRVKQIIKHLENLGVNEPYIDAALMTFSRAYLIYGTVKPLLDTAEMLQKRTAVISKRGLTSTFSYNVSDSLLLEYLLIANSFVPHPNVIYLLDVDPKTAMERVYSRKEGTWGGDKGKWETKLDEMKRIRNNFLNLEKILINVEVIDANRGINEIHQDITERWVRRFES